jgi:cell division protein FtsL
MSSYAGTVNMNTMPRRKAASRKTARAAATSNRASRGLVRLVVILMISIFVLVCLSCYAATIQHANNVLREQNSMLQAEIDSLNSQIAEETKVTKIERLAVYKYGMVHPTSENCIVISESAESEGNLAATIKGEAYN